MNPGCNISLSWQMNLFTDNHKKEVYTNVRIDLENGKSGFHATSNFLSMKTCLTLNQTNMVKHGF